MGALSALLRADSREAVRDGNHLRRLDDQTFRGLDVDPATGFEAASRPAGAASQESVPRGCYLSSMTFRSIGPTNLSLEGGCNEVFMTLETLRPSSTHLVTPRAAVDILAPAAQAFAKRCNLILLA